MNEDKKPNDGIVNQVGEGKYSYKFDPNASRKDAYLGGYQPNNHENGRVRTKSLSSPFAKNPYGIRDRIGSIGSSNGYWKRGAISVLGIVIILGILVLVISFFAN